MGEVFLAQDTKLERKVAIKMLPAKSIDDPLARKRLFREARAAATLDHPNICSIHEVNEDGDCLFIVMQYVEGKTLATTLVDSPLTPDQVIDVGIQVAEALSEAHAHGVIHRDIKPQNVIITPRGQLKVLDFGLARVTQNEQNSQPEAKTVTQLTEEGYIVGTVSYMSPEQLKGQAVDARSDLFSLGVMLYECAAGKPPFTGSSKIEISSKVLQVEPRKPSELNPGIPHGLEEVILKAMTKEVGDRYQTADEVLQDLKQSRTSLSGVTELLPSATRHPSSTLGGAAQNALRLRWVQILLVAVPVLIIATWIALRLWRPSPYQPSEAARQYYDDGVKAMRAGTFLQARKQLEQSIALDDRYAPAHARLAEAYLETNDTENAQSELILAGHLASGRALDNGDQAYLDAIGATIARDFPRAINLYQQILDRAPNSNSEKANANVDLGRAYERNESLDKAIDKAAENYLAATKLDPQSPAAFLHLGIAYSRKQQLQQAEEAFKTAERLYGLKENHEGLAEVLYQRGVLYFRNGKIDDSKQQLEALLEMLRNDQKQNLNNQNVDNNYQVTKAELQLSLVYRDAGNIDKAKELAADAIRIAQSSNLKNVATTGLIDLGLALLSRGDLDEAGQCFQQALAFAQRDKSQVDENRATLALGRLSFERSNNDEAISQLGKALAFFEPAGYRRETSIALSVLGRAHQDKGEDDAALKLFEKQFQLATDSSDQSGIGDSHMNKALLLGMNQELYTEALAHLDEKLKIDQARGRQASRGIAFDQMNRGNFLWQLGRYDEARAALNEAFEISNRPETQYKGVLAWVHLINARIALSQLRYADAKKEGQLALDVSGERFPDVALQAKYCIGLAEALSGAAQPGRTLCEKALEMAKKTNSRQLITSGQLALAEAFLNERNAAAAQQNALELEKIFGQSGQKDSEWRALLIAARASDVSDDKATAQSYASRADSACKELQQKWGAEAYESYLRRPDIQMYRKQLVQLTGGK
jgi:tetratricopeptide (TPR) repeat protein/tRNA A-37 threonylcarbamoyl transferase component Bud32